MIRYFFILSAAFALASCDHPDNISAQVAEINQQVADYQKATAILNTESSKMGNLGTYERNGPVENASLQSHIDAIARDITQKKETLEQTKAHIKELQDELDAYRASL